MNEQKSSEIIHVCPENFSLLQYILKKMLHLKESGIQIALQRSSNEVANRVSYNDVKEIQNLHVFAALARIRNYCDARKVKIDYKNIDTIIVKSNPFIVLLGIAGIYNSVNNKLSFSLASATTHELLHALSTHYEKEQGKYRSGFKIHSFFYALNEGYTELLASRIEKRPPDSYPEQIKLVRLVESLFDSKEEMMQAYFDNNLEAVFQKIGEYMPRKEVTRLLLKEDKALQRQMQTAFIGLIGKDSVPQRLALYQAVVTNCQDFNQLERFLRVAAEDKELQVALRLTNAVSSIKKTFSRLR